MRARWIAVVASLVLMPGIKEPIRRALHRLVQGGAQDQPVRGGADTILVNGKIWTWELPARITQGAAIANGRFLAVGTNEEVRAFTGTNTKVIDLRGRLAVPGFIDSHVHFLEGGFRLLELNLKDARDEAEFVRRVAEKAKTVPAGRWIQGGNWDEEAWPDAKLPTRWMIDGATPNNPVWISRYDGHAGLANSLALKLAGIKKETKSTPGGVIVRDEKTGEPTGVLKDDAEGMVERAIPRPSEAEVEEALRAALREAARLGVTSVQDIAASSESPNGSFTGEIQLLRRAELDGWLTCRFYEITPIEEWKKLADAGISHGMGSDYLRLGALKGFADGSLGSRTAWMFEPFDDDPGNRGLRLALLDPPSHLEDVGRAASAAHIQLAIHAIGDRANAEVLDAFARIGGDRPASYRFRIEHAQHVRREDFTRFAKLGVIASMQPYHAIDDGRWAEKRIGLERARSSYAWRSLLRAGARLAFGTDWPVAPLDPILSVSAAVTRATLDGKHPGGWFPEERLSVEESLGAYTQGAAYAAFEEGEKGTISPGKLADLVVVSDDLFQIPPEKIKDARVVLTVVGGRVVYQAP